MASGEEPGRHGAARLQHGVPLAYFPAINTLSKKQNLYQNWLTHV